VRVAEALELGEQARVVACAERREVQEPARLATAVVT
jgi:hypothetical protein